MKKITNEYLINAVLTISGAIAAYFFVVKPLLEKLGLKKTEEVKATEEKNKIIIEDNIVKQKKIKPSTKTDFEWKVIADSIYEFLKYSSLSDNKRKAAFKAMTVQNNTDLAILFKYFAKRREYLLGIPSGSLMNLVQFLSSNLDKETINIINSNWRRKGITVRI